MYNMLMQLFYMYLSLFLFLRMLRDQDGIAPVVRITQSREHTPKIVFAAHKVREKILIKFTFTCIFICPILSLHSLSPFFLSLSLSPFSLPLFLPSLSPSLFPSLFPSFSPSSALFHNLRVQTNQVSTQARGLGSQGIPASPLRGRSPLQL